MDSIKIKMYYEAARILFSDGDLAEEWLDGNSIRLTGNISSIKEAKQEILNLF